MRPRNIEENLLAISKTLKEIKNQGCKKISLTNGGNEIFTQTDYIFEKE